MITYDPTLVGYTLVQPGVEVIPFKLTIPSNTSIPIEYYSRGANGGTFDYLHYGHKILLSISMLMLRDHITIGISMDILL